MNSSLLAILTPLLLAQPSAGPPLPAFTPPPSYQVKLRYEMLAFRTIHVQLYDAMIEHLKSLDFQFDPPLDEQPRQNRENPFKNDLAGAIASDKALAILRNQSVASLLLVPAGYAIPAVDQPVRVRLELAGGLPAARQLELRRQTLAMLHELGFSEAIGYDSRGCSGAPYTRLQGTILAGQLELLLKDLRRQPTGWLGPLVQSSDLPTPLKNVAPVIVIEVLADAEPPAPLVAPEPRPEPALEKLSANLWDIVKQPEKSSEIVRVQIILSYRPEVGSTWRQLLMQAAPSLFIEGQVGPIVTALAPAGEIAPLAALGEISAIRLPQPARVQVDPALRFKTDNEAILQKTGLAGLHAVGLRGQGVRLVLVDSDFRGWQKLLKARRLPPKTRFIDLTAELSALLDAAPLDGDEIGHGSHCALAAALAAPSVELILVRIDPGLPHSLHKVFDYTQGRPFSSHLQRRQDDLLLERGRLRAQRAELMAHRKRILDGFDDDFNSERDFGFLGPVRGWLFSERAWLHNWMQHQDREEEKLAQQQERLNRLLGDILTLNGANILVTSLAWHSGYPLLTERPISETTLWFQSAGNIKGQCWHGLFRDNGDGALRFLPPGQRLPAGRWSSDVNFLGWQMHEGKVVPELPDQAKMRASVQWREPHDRADAARINEDPYLKPLADLRLIVLRQRDPDGKTLPVDLFDVVAFSSGLPQRLDNQPASAVYEISVDFPVEKPGRYAIRLQRRQESQWLLARDEQGKPRLTLVENLTSTSIRPLGEIDLPAAAQTWELYPRLFIECVDDTSKLGRPIFLDFASDYGALGSPGVIQVGACNLQDGPQPYTAAGPPMNRQLAPPPQVLMYDALDVDGGPAYGSSLATPFAAGLAATALSSGVSPEQLRYHIRQRLGKVLHAGAR